MEAIKLKMPSMHSLRSPVNSFPVYILFVSVLALWKLPPLLANHQSLVFRPHSPKPWSLSSSVSFTSISSHCPCTILAQGLRDFCSLSSHCFQVDCPPSVSPSHHSQVSSVSPDIILLKILEWLIGVQLVIITGAAAAELFIPVQS